MLPSGRAQWSRPASLEGAPGASITGDRVFEARPLTMKRCAAFFQGQPRGKRDALSNLKMPWRDAGGTGQGLELIDFIGAIFFSGSVTGEKPDPSEMDKQSPND